MLTNLKCFHCPDPGPEYDAAKAYGKVRLGDGRLFWKSGLRRYAVSLSDLRRAWRQEENVYGKLCLGGRSYTIHRIVLVLADETQLTIHVGDDAKDETKALLQAIAEKCPDVMIGKA